MHRKFFTLFLFLLIGCGEDREFHSARKMEKLGRYPKAVAGYDRFIKEKPRHPRAPEALFRAGEIYRTIIKDFSKARLYYDRVMKVYPDSPWVALVNKAVVDSPDYFPLRPDRKRRMGDSQSGGKIMLMEDEFQSIEEHPDQVSVERKIFAGKKQVGNVDFVYEKKGKGLRQYRSGSNHFALVLRYPPVKSLSWETLRGPQRTIYTIEGVDESVQVKGGTFEHCIKVRQQSADSASTWKYEYYAPFEGLVLTTVATEKNETRIMELLSNAGEGQDVSQETGPGLFERILSWFR